MNYESYFDQYTHYSKTHILGQKYLTLGVEVRKTKNYQLLFYKGLSQKKKVFLIIPSIFNSPEILFLSRNKSFIDNLRLHGDIFLINWLEIDNPEHLLEDYVKHVIEVIYYLNQQNIFAVNLIGHCIGGNLAIATCVIEQTLIHSLTLLTTPWDFSHFALINQLHEYLKLDASIKELPIIPKIHIQILFFLLFPNYFNEKLDKFFTLTSEQEKDLSFRIEHWLISGGSLPKATYNQIMYNVLKNNMFTSGKWKICENILVDPSLINIPVYNVVATKDKIVPKSSILPLHNLFKNSTLFEVEGGHISYLINNKLGGLFHAYE